MRPTKLTQRVISIFNEVLATDHNALVCTDEELCILVNDRLNEHERISYRTFQRYKAKAMRLAEEAEEQEQETQDNTPENKPEKTEQQQENSWLYEKLYIIWRKAIIKQKNQLMGLVLEAKQGWQRYKWLLEKKMQEWQQIPQENAMTDNVLFKDNIDWRNYRLGLSFS